MWPEQPFHGNWKLNAGTRIGSQELLANRHIEHAPENTKLLVHCGGLDHSQLSITQFGFDANSLPKALAKMQLNQLGGEFRQYDRTECVLEVLCTPLICLVSFFSTHGR